MRRITLDPTTAELLVVHRQRYEHQVRRLGQEPSDKAFLFSHQPMHDRPYDPSAASHCYADMCAALGIDSHLHALPPARVSRSATSRRRLALGHATNAGGRGPATSSPGAAASP